MRPSGRAPDQMRTLSFEPGFTKHAEGSCLVSFGDTRVLVTASLEEKVPPFLRGCRAGRRTVGGACWDGRMVEFRLAAPSTVVYQQ